MPQAVSRRNFLRAKFRPLAPEPRPPWSLAEEEFLSLCNRCGECLVTCPTGILEKGDGGFPRVNFQRGECTFCGNCAQHCSTGAIRRDDARQVPWRLKAVIDDRCLAPRGIVCQVCSEQCPSHAVRFVPKPGLISVPVLDVSACRGCGACVATCPAQAISLTEVQ